MSALTPSSSGGLNQGSGVRVRRSGLRYSAFLSAAIAFRPLQASTTITITESQQTKLIQLVQTNTEAMQLFQKLVKFANASLYTLPQPVVRIETAGRLST